MLILTPPLRNEIEKQILEALLERTEIDVNIQNNEGKTALQICAKKDNAQCASLLLKRSDIMADIKDNNGWTPFITASYNMSKEVLQEMMLMRIH